MLKKLLLVICILGVSLSSFALKWEVIKNENFTIFYGPEQEKHAVQILKILEYYRPYLEKLNGNKIKGLPVVIEDTGVNYNGFADPIYKTMHLFSYSPDSNFNGESWWRLVGTHEYTHMLQMSNVNGVASFMNSIVGQLMTPNALVPGWIFEGITVYQESQHSPYEGRLNTGLFDEYLKVRVAEDKLYNMVQANYNISDFSISGFYLYGSEFFKYLAMKYGEDKFAQLFIKNSENTFGVIGVLFPALCLDDSAKKIYGKTFEELWQEWHVYLKAELKVSEVKYEKMTDLGRGTFTRAINNNKLYYTTQDVSNISGFTNFVINKIIERDLSTDKERVIYETKSGLFGKIKVVNNNLYFGSYNLVPGYNNTESSGLGTSLKINEIALDSLNFKTLTEGNYRTFGVDEQGKLIIAEDLKDRFACDLYSFDKNTGKKEKILSSDFIIDNIEIYKDSLIVSAQKDFDSFNIYKADLKTGEFKALVSTPYIENEITVFGDKIFYTANYEKAHNVYCYDLGSNKNFKITKGEFASRGLYDEKENKVYLTGLSSKGYDVFRTNAEFTEFAIPDYPPSVKPDLSKVEVKYEKGSYIDNLATMIPAFRIPIVNYLDKEWTVGIYMMGNSAIKDLDYTLMGTYNINKNLPSIDFSINSKILAPFISTTSVVYKDNMLSLSEKYRWIAYNNAGDGLNQIIPGFKIASNNNFKRNSITPSVEFQLSGLTTTLDTDFAVPIERKEVFSSINRLGAEAIVNLKQIAGSFTINFNTLYKYDPDNPDIVFDNLRGSETTLTMKNGFVSKFDLEVPVLNIRNGLWNPNIYIEDISLVLFGDIAVPMKTNLTSSDLDYSFGIGIKPEFGTFFLAKAAITYGVVLDKKFKPQFYFNFGM